MASLEQDIATNPIALSPLLLKRDGLLTREVEGWCDQACVLLDTLANELHILRPNVFDRRARAAELLGRRLRALMELGLETLTTSGELVANKGVGQALETLLEGLVSDFLDLWRREVELIVSSYALRVERDEPDGGSEDFRAAKARRGRLARSVVEREIEQLLIAQEEHTPGAATAPAFLEYWWATTSPANAADSPADEQLAAGNFSSISSDLESSIARFKDVRKQALEELTQLGSIAECRQKLDWQVTAAVGRHVELYRRRADALDAVTQAEVDAAFPGASPDAAAKVKMVRAVFDAASAAVLREPRFVSDVRVAQAGFDAKLAELVDRTLLFFRVEVLKDVVEANHKSGMPRSTLARTDYVSQALHDVREVLKVLSGGELYGTLVEQYCTVMFKEGRRSVLCRALGATLQPDSKPSTRKADGLTPGVLALMPSVQKVVRAARLASRRGGRGGGNRPAANPPSNQEESP